MTFEDANRDGEFLAELREEQVVGPPEQEVLHRLSAGRETVRLTDLLIAAAASIPQDRWLEWLMHNHACLRLHELRVDEAGLRQAAFTADQSRLFLASGNFPAILADAGWLIAVTRPDRFADIEAALAPRRCYRSAATLTEAGKFAEVIRRIANL